MRGTSRTYYALQYPYGFDLQRPTYPFEVVVHRFTSNIARAERLLKERDRMPLSKQRFVKVNSTNRFVNMAWVEAIATSATSSPWPITLRISEARMGVGKKFFYARQHEYIGETGRIPSAYCKIHRFETVQQRDMAVTNGGGSPKWAALGASSELVSRAKAKSLEAGKSWPVEITRTPASA